MTSERKRKNPVEHIKNHLKQEVFNKHQEEFDAQLQSFLEIPESKEKIKTMVVSLIIGILQSPGKEAEVIKIFMEEVRPFFLESFNNDEQKLQLFLEYFTRKITKTVCRGLEDNENRILEIFQLSIPQACRAQKAQDVFTLAAAISFVKPRVDNNLSDLDDRKRIKTFARIFYEKLKGWAKKQDQKEPDTYFPLLPLIKTKYVMRVDEGELIPLLFKVVIFLAVAKPLISWVWGPMYWDTDTVNRAASQVLQVGMVIAPLIYLSYQRTVKRELLGRINQGLVSLLKDRISIDWDQALKVQQYFPVTIRNSDRPAIPSMPPAPAAGMSGHTYRQLAGLASSRSLSSGAVVEEQDFPEEKKEEKIAVDPDTLRTSSGASYKGVFDKGELALEKLGLPSAQHLQQFRESYLRGMSKKQGAHNTPGVVLLDPQIAKGWHAELVPTGNLEGRILGSMTVETDGSRTLHFRYYQSTHNVRKWPPAPAPFPPGYDVLKTDDPDELSLSLQ